MASLMKRTYPFISNPLPDNCMHRIFKAVLFMAASHLILPNGHAEDSAAVHNTGPTAAWDWTLLGWKTLDQLSADQKTLVPPACCGTFIQPDQAAPKDIAIKKETADENEDISITGVSSHITKRSTIMIGDVELMQGQRKISGDAAELFNDPQGVSLQGNVLFREPGFLLQGSDASIDLEQNTLQVENVRYVLHEQQVHGEAGEIQRDTNGVITLIDSTYSSCTPGDELWYLKSGSMTLDTVNGQGTATNVRVEVFDVPVFYFPYMMFPIGDQRHSGFLAPSFSNGEDGVDISVPYYLNLAPNYDAVLVPRYIADRGSQIGGEFNYLAPSYTASTAATWLADEELDENRWLIALQQKGGRQEPWSTTVDITRVSDNDYFDDLDNSGLSVSRGTDLQQRGAASYMTDHWYTEIEVLEYQTLRDNVLKDPYYKLPDISAAADYYLGGGFATRLSQSVTRFEHGDQNQVTGDRLSGDYRLEWRSNWQAGYIVPAVELHFLEQKLTNSIGDEDPAMSIPAANIDMGLIFMRDEGAYQQTLEPRLFYSYTEYKNQNDFQLFDTDEMTFGYAQLFRNYRFSGSDRIGDTNQTSVGLTSRWIDKTTGTERLQIGAGKIFYNEDRKVVAYDPVIFALLPQSVQDSYTNNQSPIVGSFQWSINSLWRLNSELIWSEEEHKTNSANMFLHYKGPAEQLFSVGYRYLQLLEWAGLGFVQETVKQGDVSAYLPITDQWALVGRVFYDFTNDRNIESLAGFQYEDCCWKLRAVYRNWATNPDEVYDVSRQDSETGVYLEFEFKNLAGVGTKTNNMLKDSIYGYDKNE